MCLYIVAFNFIYRNSNKIDKIVLSIEIYGWYRILMVNNIVIISFFSFCIVFLSDICKRKGWIRQIYLPTLTFLCTCNIYVYDFLLFKFNFFSLSSQENNKIVIISKLPIGYCMIIMIKILNLQFLLTSDL